MHFNVSKYELNEVTTASKTMQRSWTLMTKASIISDGIRFNEFKI